MRWLVMAAVLAAAPAGATELEVRVLNVADGAGRVRAEVCLAGEWLKDGCALKADVAAHAGVVRVVVHGVAPGVYAVVAHHDRDGDGEVNRNFLGIPTEGVGFSRGGSIVLSAPGFRESSVRVEEGRVVVEVRLAFE